MFLIRRTDKNDLHSDLHTLSMYNFQFSNISFYSLIVQKDLFDKLQSYDHELSELYKNMDSSNQDRQIGETGFMGRYGKPVLWVDSENRFMGGQGKPVLWVDSGNRFYGQIVETGFMGRYGKPVLWVDTGNRCYGQIWETSSMGRQWKPVL